MSAVQHTPGPWQVGPAFDNFGEPEIIIEHHTQAGNLVVAVALPGLQGQEANAQLIAAAPDLLKVVLAALDEYDFTDRKGSAPWADAAREAVVKAIG